MRKHLDTLIAAVTRLDKAWSDADTAADLDRAELLAVNDAIGAARRLLDGTHADIAASIAHESRTELGTDSLAKQQGFRNAKQLIATTTGISTGEAARLISVGAATAPRTDLIGTRLPARYPAAQAALATGDLGVHAAALIIALLDRVRLKIDAGLLVDAEALLVALPACRSTTCDD